jgi:hypothetical protein
MSEQTKENERISEHGNPEELCEACNKKVFETWKHLGTRFLAFNGGSGIIIIDERGVSYGSWRSVESFKKECRQTLPMGVGVVARLCPYIN